MKISKTLLTLSAHSTLLSVAGQEVMAAVLNSSVPQGQAITNQADVWRYLPSLEYGAIIAQYRKTA